MSEIMLVPALQDVTGAQHDNTANGDHEARARTRTQHSQPYPRAFRKLPINFLILNISTFASAAAAAAAAADSSLMAHPVTLPHKVSFTSFAFVFESSAWNRQGWRHC
jgi:hypothetical protein